MSHHDHDQSRKDSDQGANARPSADAAEPERPQTIQEAEGQSPNQQEDPPKAEGDRDEAETRPRRQG